MYQVKQKDQLNARIYQQYASNYIIQHVPLEDRILTIRNKQYHFEKKLGRGSFGTVYMTHLQPYNTSFAVKVISLATNNPGVFKAMASSCSTEIAMAKRLAKISEHIVHVYEHDYDREIGLSYIVMELGEHDLEYALSQRFTLWRAERKSIWRQLVDIGVALHSQKIVHRDIKPGNLVIFSGNLIKLVDFGIAKEVNAESIGRHGSPPYSAPEITMASKAYLTNTTTKADVWSLGAILYRMTYMAQPTYKTPCYRPPAQTLSTNDPDLLDILRRVLVRNPERRPDARWLVRHPYTTTS